MGSIQREEGWEAFKERENYGESCCRNEIGDRIVLLSYQQVTITLILV